MTIKGFRVLGSGFSAIALLLLSVCTAVAKPIRDLPSKTTPASADLVLIEDVSGKNWKLRIDAITGSGGGSGNVATDPIFTAKGDLVVGTGFQTSARVPIGANGTIPVADSTQTTGMRFGAKNIDFAIDSEQVGTNTAVNWTSGKTMFTESVALTANRASLLPPANAYAPGTIIHYVDSLTTLNFGRSFARSGTDTLNGGTASITPFVGGALSGASVAKFKSNGTNAWMQIDTVGQVIEVRDPVDRNKKFTFDASAQVSGTAGSVKAAPGNSVTVLPSTGIGQVSAGVDANGNIVYVAGLPDPIGHIGEVLTVSQDETYVLTPGGSGTGGSGGGLSIQPFSDLVSSGGTFTWAWDATRIRQNRKITLASGANTLAITNPINGMPFELQVAQPSSGAAGTLTLPAGSETPGGTAGVITLSSANNASDTVRGSFNGNYYRFDAPILNLTRNTVISANPEILWWKLNDGPAGTTATATVGPNGTPGTSGTPVWWTHGTGYGLWTAGGRLMTTESSISYSTSVITLSLLVNDGTWEISTTQRNMMSSGTTGSNGSYRVAQVGTGVAGSGKIIATIGGTGGTVFSRSIPAPSVGTDHIIDVVLDNTSGAAAIKIYLDGALQTLTSEGSANTGSGNFATNTFQLGSSNIDCKDDDIRIFDHELTASQISTKYTNGYQ